MYDFTNIKSHIKTKMMIILSLDVVLENEKYHYDPNKPSSNEMCLCCDNLDWLILKRLVLVRNAEQTLKQ